MLLGASSKENVIGIDLGTSKLRVCLKNKGVVYNEPSCCAVRRNDGKTISFGNSARALDGKTDKDVLIIDIVKNSRIASWEKAKELFGLVIGSFKSFSYSGPKIVCTVPADMSEVDSKALEEVLFESGANAVIPVNVALASAYGCAVNPKSAKGSLVVDIGAGSTTCAVVTCGGIASSKSISLGGNAMTEAIIKYMSLKCGLRLGMKEAERIKCRAGLPNTAVIGKNMHNLLPGVVEIYRDEVIMATEEIMFGISETIRETLRATPPELCADIYDSGVVLCGGAALMSGLDIYIAKHLNLPVKVAKKSENCAIEGISRIIDSGNTEAIRKKSGRYTF